MRRDIGCTVTELALNGLTHQLTLDGRRCDPADYIMASADIARVAVLIPTLLPEADKFKATILPIAMTSFIGRG